MPLATRLIGFFIAIALASSPGVADVPPIDQQIILGLQGDYLSSHQDRKTGLVTNEHARRDRSGTCTSSNTIRQSVQLLTNSGNVIGLQHLLVDPRLDNPSVVVAGLVDRAVSKHYRQHWQWMPDFGWKIHPTESWQKVPFSESESSNSWLWTVYDIHDTPLVAVLGRWWHTPQRSIFSGHSLRRLQTVNGSENSVSIQSETEFIRVDDQYSTVTIANEVFPPYSAKAQVETRLLGAQANALASTTCSMHNAIARYWSFTADYWQDVRALWANLLTTYSTLNLQKSKGDLTLLEYHQRYSFNRHIQRFNTRQRMPILQRTYNGFILHAE